MRKTTRHIIEVIAAAIAAAAVGLGVLAWLVASGPVSLGVLEPTIEGVLSQALPEGQKVDFKKAYVHWARDGRALRLRVVDVRILDKDGETAATFPEVDLGFSVSALGRGLIAPTRVLFRGSDIRVLREADGTVRLGGLVPGNPEQARIVVPPTGEAGKRDAPSPPGEDDDLMAGLIDQLLAPPDRQARLGYLQAVVIEDARLTFHDTNLGATFTAPTAAVELRRTEEGLDLNLDATFAVGEEVSNVTLRGTYEAETRKSGIRFAFTDVNPADLAQLSPKLFDLAQFDLPVRGSVTFEAEQGRIPRLIDFKLAAGPGMVESPIVRIPLRREILKLASADLAARVDLSSGRIELQRLGYEIGTNKGTFRGHAVVELDAQEELTLSRIGFALKGRDIVVDVPGYSERPATVRRFELDGDFLAQGEKLTVTSAGLSVHGATITLSGDLEYADDLALRLKGSVDNLDTQHLMRLWPEMTALGARDWIRENVKSGIIDKGTFMLNAPKGTLDKDFLPNEALRVTFALTDVTTNFVPGLPPMTDLQANAVLLGNRFDLTVDSARIGSVAVRGGSMALGNLAVRGTPAAFTAEVDGPMQDILGLLDMGPLGYPSQYGIDPSSVGGQGEVVLNLKLPLLRYLKIEQIEFAASGKTKGLSMPEILSGRDLTDGDIELQIRPAGLSGTGTLALSGLPLNVTWREDFTGMSDMPTYFQVAGQLDDQSRSILGIDSDYVRGPLDFTLTAQGRGQSIRTIKFRTDFKDTEFVFANVDWKKEAGEVGAGEFMVSIGETGAINVQDIVVASKDILIRGGFQLADNLRLLGAQFERIKLGPVMNLTLDARRNDQKLAVTLRGERLHAGPFLDTMFDSAGGSPSTGEAEQAPEPAADTPKGAPFTIDAQIEALELKSDTIVKDVSFKLSNNGESIEEVTLNGAFAGGGTVYGNLDRTAPGKRNLTLTASDAGRMFSGLLDTDSVREGRMVLKARVLDADGGIKIKGRLSVEEFRIVNTPFFARLLTVASFRGLNDLLQGEGIRFKRLRLPFESRESSWTFEDARAYGNSLGITLEGRFDEAQVGTDLRGTIVPAYSLNRVLGSVPLLGNILVNREGEGLFAITYRIVGSDEGLNIFVNPLSALAPGFLRRLFEIGSGDATEPPKE